MSAPDGERDLASAIPALEGAKEDELRLNKGPRKYQRLSRVYIASLIRKETDEPATIKGEEKRRGYTYVYSRRHKRKRKIPFFDQILLGFPEGYEEGCEEDQADNKYKRRRADCNGSPSDKKGNERCLLNGVENPVGSPTKKWVCLSFQDVDPCSFVGLQCEVYWPLDACWYNGHVVDFDSESRRHKVKYADDEEENLILSNERIKFHVSFEEMQDKNLKVIAKRSETDGLDVDELMVLAASFDGSDEIETGDIIWAKLTGHATWPAIVLDEFHAHKLNKGIGEKSVPVQFFGTHDFARVRHKQVISFLKGLFSSYHLKCRKPTFLRGLEEAKMYLSEQRLPEMMLQLRDGIETDMGCIRSEEPDCAPTKEEGIQKKLNDLKTFPLKADELQVISFGKIVEDSTHFQNDRYIWPEGYIAARMFNSITDPSVLSLYRMEVLRDAESSSRPLFKVTTDCGEEFSGSTPSACWNKIYKRIKKVQMKNPDYNANQTFASGSYMFGFSSPEVSKLMKEMTGSRSSVRFTCSSSKKTNHSSAGYRQVDVQWRDLDKCNVCHMDEEYENNLFLQCDKCRMMVHARCYGELEPTGGDLWLCNLCRPGAPESPPRCCLCPVTGGAMKPTTDGRWAHLACAIWIPETCFADVKKMEPIDGLHRVSKDRWKLLCSICDVSHGACIQCSNPNCRVAYHPLCARAAGFCLETEDMDNLRMIPFDEDEESQRIQLISFCRKHRPSSSNEQSSLNRKIDQKASSNADYVPHVNPSGCARAEPYNFLLRRGRKETELLAALSNRLYVENKPHLLGGSSPHMPLWNKSSSNLPASKHYLDLQKLRIRQLNPSREILSVADKYNYMRETFKKRLAFGKSGIHGYGVFAKLPHRAGDMVIEYIGELIRPRVADRREHLIYNSLVGAGTYMFRIDDDRVIDATRAGSIAHLINHSCEPNCYSRVITVLGENHIIIFAKRDIKQWEELTYDYRFVSADERLPCFCGASRCRGVVNDTETEERVGQICVPISEVVDWRGE